jgi:hypothetical protein
MKIFFKLILLFTFFHKLINYDGWLDPGFWFFFIMSSIMAFLLNYSWMLCTKYNSPLTTTVIGCLKVSYFNVKFEKSLLLIQ